MARVGRLAGAILIEAGEDCYLVGHPKVPCDWRAAGFAPPGEIDARVEPVVRLVRDRDAGPLRLAPPVLAVEAEAEGLALARLVAERLVIARTGSVSERLWRLVIGDREDPGDPGDPGDPYPAEPLAGGAPAAIIQARWLGELPPAIWQIVRDTVLRCT